MTFSLVETDAIKSIIDSFVSEFLEREKYRGVKSADRRSSQEPRSNSGAKKFLRTEQPLLPHACRSTSRSVNSIRQVSSSVEKKQIVSVHKNDEEAIGLLNIAKETLDPRNRMRFLNKCIATAESYEMLAEAYTNRADFLCRIKEQDLALLDINRAYAPVQSKKPRKFQVSESLKSWLVQLKVKSDFALRARGDYRRMAIEYPFKVGPDRSARAEAFKFSRKTRVPDESQLDATVYEDIPHDIWNTYNNCPSRKLSDKVQLTYTIENGWHWVAKEEIVPGELLSIQDYFAIKISEENMHFYCSYCTIWFLAPIPCRTCQTEMYCSERCRKIAYESYHETECRLLPHLSNLKERELTLLALRIFLTGTKQDNSELFVLDSKVEVYNGMFERDTRSEQHMLLNNYLTVSTLMWDKLFTELLDSNLRNDVIEVFLGLRRINFFHTKSDVFSPSFRKEEKIALVFLVQNVALLSYNRSGIDAQFFKEDSDNRPQIKSIGSGLHTLHSLLNNSCSAPAAKIRDRRRELIFAVRPIAAGEEIYVSYSGDYGKKAYRERKKDLLDQHGIDRCCCVACRKKWQPWNGLSSHHQNRYHEQNKKKRKEHEKTIATWQRKFERFLADPAETTEVNLEVLCKARSYHLNCLKTPSVSLWLCEDLIKQFMWTLRGDFRTSLVETNPSPPPQRSPISAEL